MKPVQPVLSVLLICALAGCSALNQAVTVTVAGPSLDGGGDPAALAGAGAPEAYAALEPEGSSLAAGGGVDPDRALSAAEAETARWKRRPLPRLRDLPAAFKPGGGEPVAAKPAGKGDPDAPLRRIEGRGRAVAGAVCEGC